METTAMIAEEDIPAIEEAMVVEIEVDRVAVTEEVMVAVMAVVDMAVIVVADGVEVAVVMGAVEAVVVVAMAEELVLMRWASTAICVPTLALSRSCSTLARPKLPASTSTRYNLFLFIYRPYICLIYETHYLYTVR